jgi:hypothetical protein
MTTDSNKSERIPIIKPGVGVSLVRRKQLNDRIFAVNLRAFLTTLGWIVNYDFDARDWELVSAGLSETSFARGQWCDHELLGTHSARLRIALGDSDEIYVQTDISVELVPQVRLALDIFNSFKCL